MAAPSIKLFDTVFICRCSSLKKCRSIIIGLQEIQSYQRFEGRNKSFIQETQSNTQKRSRFAVAAFSHLKEDFHVN